MAKLTREQKTAASIATHSLIIANARVFFSRQARAMIAFIPTETDSKNQKIFEMYVTLCHEKDEFKKKLGILYIMENMDMGHKVLVRSANCDLDGLAFDFLYRQTNDDVYDVEEMELK